MGERRHEILAGELGVRWDDNIKIDLNEAGFGLDSYASKYISVKFL
jgi:hypothetical protein